MTQDSSELFHLLPYLTDLSPLPLPPAQVNHFPHFPFTCGRRMDEGSRAVALQGSLTGGASPHRLHRLRR